MLPNFIIGGPTKTATTALYTYLNAHPDVSGSSVKETGFFLKPYTGNRDEDALNYSKFFEEAAPDSRVIMEATTSYFLSVDIVGPRIKKTVPDVRLLFMLRSPADRLYSFFNYNLNVTTGFKDGITFDEYLDISFDYLAGKGVPRGCKIKEKRLRDPIEVGRYAIYLERYFEIFGRERVKAMFFEFLKEEPEEFMAELCSFIGIDPSFYKGYTFEKVNVSAPPKSKTLHKVMNKFNKNLDRISPHRQETKNRIASLYNSVNRDKGERLEMSEEARSRLEEYYMPFSVKLKELLPDIRYPAWVG